MSLLYVDLQVIIIRFVFGLGTSTGNCITDHLYPSHQISTQNYQIPSSKLPTICSGKDPIQKQSLNIALHVETI